MSEPRSQSIPNQPSVADLRRTGIALVPDTGQPLPATIDGEEDLGPDGVVHYHFPVEIEVRAAPEPVDLEWVVGEALRRLAVRLENS